MKAQPMQVSFEKVFENVYVVCVCVCWVGGGQLWLIHGEGLDAVREGCCQFFGCDPEREVVGSTRSCLGPPGLVWFGSECDCPVRDHKEYGQNHIHALELQIDDGDLHPWLSLTSHM